MGCVKTNKQTQSNVQSGALHKPVCDLEQNVRAEYTEDENVPASEQRGKKNVQPVNNVEQTVQPTWNKLYKQCT